ncbi:HNH endonuclease [Arthrobacter frigidicola]|nr:HNH endonuclease [Arthrobacter frigidicola]
MHASVPLIWFFGVGKGIFRPEFPVFVVGEEEDRQQFILDPSRSVNSPQSKEGVEELPRRYRMIETRQRLFQGVFRGIVMRAYGDHCAVCGLQQSRLLDAAHILPDSDKDGIASVTNGIALCKLHHSAFDVGILGIRPDLVVQVQPRIMHERGGPMLRYGFQEVHGKKISVPSATAERPRPDFLERSFLRFTELGEVA